MKSEPSSLWLETPSDAIEMAEDTEYDWDDDDYDDWADGLFNIDCVAGYECVGNGTTSKIFASQNLGLCQKCAVFIGVSGMVRMIYVGG